MLSFFAKKKQSPDTPPEEAIQGPADHDNGAGGGDDFIFVEKKGTDDDPKKFPQHMAMYPPMPPSFGMGGGYHGSAIYPPAASGGLGAGSSTAAPVPYVQGVPFELAPQLCTKSAFEVTQLQVDSILAMLTRQMSIDEQEEYNFTLERSIQSECY